MPLAVTGDMSKDIVLAGSRARGSETNDQLIDPPPPCPQAANRQPATPRPGSRFQLHNPVLERPRHGFGPVRDAELPENAAHVKLDGALRDVERPRDLPVPSSGHQEPQHFELARRQLRTRDP